MTPAKTAGRLVAAMLLTQMVVSPIVNFVLLLPIFSPPGFLVQSAAHANEISLAAVLGIARSSLVKTAGAYSFALTGASNTDAVAFSSRQGTNPPQLVMKAARTISTR